MLDTCDVVYEELDGWKGKGKVAGVKRWEDLPDAAKRYVEFIEGRVGVKVGFIGTGVGREDMVVR